MTTGRINQVTIVWHPFGAIGAVRPREIVTEMIAPGVRWRPKPASGPCGLLLPPSKFPREERARAPAALAAGRGPNRP